MSLMLLFMLGGCGKLETMSIDTKLNINSSFDGERVMSMTMTSDVVDALFEGDTELMRQTIEKYCPTDMGCTIETSGDDVSIRFVIPFASLSEYQMKISTILNSDDNPNKDTVDASVYYDYSDTMFKHGYVIEESFDSTDLFYWLTGAIKTEFPQYEDKDLSALYALGTNTLVFDETQIECGEKISYSTMESTAFKSAAVTVDLTADDGTYSGQVALVLDRDKYDQLQTLTMNEQMQSLAAEDIHYTVSLTNTEKTYTYSFTAENETQFAGYLNTIFHSQDAVFSVSYEQDDSAALQAKQTISVYANAGYYVDFSDDASAMKWIFKVASGFRLEDVADQYSFLESSSDEAVENGHLITLTTDASDQLTVTLGTDINLKQITVTTKVHSQNDFERHIVFCISEDMDELVGGNLVNLIKERVNNYITYERTEDGLNHTVNYEVTIRSDSAEQLAKLTCGFLDANDVSYNSTMSGGPDDHNSLKEIGMSYSDKIDFTQFLGGSEVEDGITYAFEYPKNYTVYLGDTEEYENVLTERNTFSFVTRNKSISIDSWAKKANIMGMIQLGLWYISLAVMLAFILINIPVIFKCVKNKSIDLSAIGLFTRKGYAIVTIFTVAAVFFVIASIRLIFRIY